jgi:hypothetical protein
MLKGTQAMTTELRPTDDQIESACLSYSHDFGLLDVAEQSKVKYAGLEWLLAWQKAMPEMGNTQAAIAAAMMGAVKPLEERDKQVWNEALEAAAAKILEMYDCSTGDKMVAAIRAMKQGGE